MNNTNTSSIIIENNLPNKLALVWSAIMVLSSILGCYCAIKCGTGPKLIHKINT